VSKQQRNQRENGKARNRQHQLSRLSSPPAFKPSLIDMLKQKDQPPTAGLKNVFSRCLLNRVKTQLRFPKVQQATFLNNIVTANTDFS